MSVTTGKVRASYVHIFTPRTPDNGGEPKYSVTLLIPKSDTATLNALYADIEKAKQDGAQKVFGGNIPPQCKIPIYDGDGYRPSGEAFGEECRGCMVVTASAKQQPVIVGLDMQNILNPADVYSGCYIRASVNMFAYNSNGNKGIGCGLNAVQKIEDGEPLSMRVSAEEAFGGANTYGNTQQYAPQPAFHGAAATAYQPLQNPTYPQNPTYGMPTQAAYQQPAVPQNPTYPQNPAYGMPMQAPAQPIDPITGRPMIGGGVMGI
ncbi:MAG: ssDNA-binding protein [Lachnospiraceae bacterium]